MGVDSKRPGRLGGPQCRRLGEHAADLEQRHVIVLMAQIMAKRVQQTWNQAWPQYIHVAAERIGQRNESVSEQQLGRIIRNQSLALRFE